MKHFARELRLHCARRGTIAQICKATGINRQQFNKYLAGQILPNARTMRKICSYLGVTEEQLMSEHLELAGSARMAAAPENDFEGIPPALLALQGSASRQAPPDGGLAVLPTGLYHCHMPVPGHPELVVRWALILRPGPRGQVFTARTDLGSLDKPPRLVRWLKYDGVVLYGARHASLVATARPPMHQSGILSVGLHPVAGMVFSGLALIHRDDGPIAKTAALQYLGDGYPARDALAGMGVLALDDATLNPIVTRLLSALPVSGTNWMRAVSLLQAGGTPGGGAVPEALSIRRLSI